MQRLRTTIFPKDFNGFLRFRGSILEGKIDLGVSWRPLGASWRRLNASWRPLGASSGDLGGILGRLRGVWRRVGGAKERSWGPRSQGGSRISGPLIS